MDLAKAAPDEHALHVAFTMLQRLVCPALDFDARASGNQHVRDMHRQISEVVTEGLGHVLGSQLPTEALLQAALPAELSGLALRLPTRQGASPQAGGLL